MGQTSFEPTPGESDGYGFGYEPSVSDTSKKRGFDFHIHMGCVISTGNR
jgi:hypothetical protein